MAFTKLISVRNYFHLLLFDVIHDKIIDVEENKHMTNVELREYLQTHDKIIDIHIEGVDFLDSDFTNKRFLCCSFKNCTFTNMKATRCHLRMSIIEFCTFTLPFAIASIDFGSITHSASSIILCCKLFAVS